MSEVVLHSTWTPMLLMRVVREEGTTMDSEEYARAIGQLVLDLRALEFVLRHYLDQFGTTSPDGRAPRPLAVGQVLPSTPLTNRDALTHLIEKFNRSVTTANASGLALDPALSELREVLLEGRIWGTDEKPPLRLVQFSAPANGLVSCTADATIDEGWLAAQADRVHAAYPQVVQAGREIHPNWWTPMATGARG
jgi:hypothetical protein